MNYSVIRRVVVLASFVAHAANSQDSRVTLDLGPEVPAHLSASLIAGEGGNYYVLDKSDNELFEIAGQSVGDALDEETSAAVNQRLEEAVPEQRAEFVRLSATSGELMLAGADSALAVVTRSGSRLIGARLLEQIGAKRFVLQEELDTSGVALAVRRFIVAYDDAGSRAVAEVKIGNVEVADDSYIAIVDETRVLYLAAREGGVVVESAALDTEIPIDPAPAESAEAPPPTDDFDDEDFSERVRSSDAEPEAGVVRAPPTRAQVVEDGRAFLTAQWTMGPKNHGVELDDRCLVPPDNLWARPPRLLNSIGTRVTAIPYKWGGYMSILEFERALRDDRLAGDVCTCRSRELNYCLVPEAAGVDCSGFVSQVWRIDYHTTSQLHRVAREISWDELKRGDALNKAGNHVRLFVGFEGDDELAIRIIESSVSCGGVCERVMSAAQFPGYRPIRLNTIMEGQ